MTLACRNGYEQTGLEAHFRNQYSLNRQARAGRKFARRRVAEDCKALNVDINEIVNTIENDDVS